MFIKTIKNIYNIKESLNFEKIKQKLLFKFNL